MTPFDSDDGDIWQLIYDRFDPALEGRREALLTLANGYLGTRGAAPEVRAGEVHYPGTYLAGCYNRLTSTVAGREVEASTWSSPHWLLCEFRAGDATWFAPSVADVLNHRSSLDLRRGLLTRRMLYQDQAGTSDVGAAATAGLDGPPARGRAADGLHPAELVRPADGALRSGRRRRQRKRRGVSAPVRSPSDGRGNRGAG